MSANIVQNSVGDIGQRFFCAIYGREQGVITVDISSRYSTVMRVTFVNVRMKIIDVIQIRGSRVLLLLFVHALNDAVYDFFQMSVTFQSVGKGDASGCHMSLKGRFDFLDARTGAIERDGVSATAIALHTRHNADLFI